MKKEYRTPEMEIVAFETEDIIRTSIDDGLPNDEVWQGFNDEELV